MSSSTVLSYFVERSPHSCANHREYALANGYRHEVVDASEGPRGPQVQALHKYEALLEALLRAEEGHFVLLLTENAAIVDPAPLANLMNEREYLLVSTSSALPQTDVQIWRSSTCSRATVHDLVKQCKLGGTPFPGEAEVLAAHAFQPWHSLVNGMCPVMHTGPNVDPRWSLAPTFAISIDKSTHSPVEMGIVPDFRNALFRHVNHCKQRGKRFFSFADSRAESQGTRSSFNPGKSIAFVTLYTPEIAAYGRIAERNFREYCDRHGHTLYVHREIPPEVGLRGTGNWLKPWLLHAYLNDHDWIVWLDADVLFTDMARRIEPLLEHRDRLLARDVGQWPFNSGVMGFRKTEANASMLYGLMQCIAGLADRSTVYAGNGDQFHFINALNEHGLLAEAEILNPMIINTPWFLRRPDSFVVHYLGMWTEMRALMMDRDERERIAGTEKSDDDLALSVDHIL
ncbi:galactosyl transferase GMA12/MNN10 domain protein [Paraburkholderia terricola]|uniref:galactosyl transferase GMA12/MNN10 domain protein n=1 Tax=Paraburkholderia terricola TaxID=169427 RepID=UPI000DEF8922|nr:galactosyl transferase GMA12/MNN10 domain protein [Paraburkholderia terricola]AXE96226.1 galactosyl transferase GMA12/MNN10 domain protein [Paraburkholderia terricola]